MTTTKKTRCWPGYEPVPDKAKDEQGSCRPKAAAKLNTNEKKFRAKRRKQLDQWQSEHPETKRSAAQHLHSPARKKPAKQKKTKAGK